MKVEAIVVAAGSGRRLKRKVSKALVKVLNIPIAIRTLKTFSIHPLITNIIIVCKNDDLPIIDSLIRKYKIKKIKLLCAGGKKRVDSVNNGVKRLDKDTNIVVIHDVARPFVDKKTITECIKKTAVSGACVVGVPVISTIKESNKNGNFIKNTLDRTRLWQIQTPQAFKVDLIKMVLKRKGRFSPTDDSLLVERLGRKVALFKGSYSNIKITTPEDILFAESLIRNRNYKK
ncbi:MAG: 2-C-methyl-D-erythritol 4-phosphate cytidylyltransferase [Candidatus Gygaella obscura]|nr:2-C-methyl-D-erythritol 4-phosphate cytidylyltransferase [Candidatus Gygaella obscura]